MFAEVRYTCQVPGCGAVIKRPWNHVNQFAKHKTLTAESKRMYTELTKSVGLIPDDVQSTTTHTTASPCPDDDSQSEESFNEVKQPQMLEVVSTTSRQKFGDTRGMAMYPLTSPVLREFHQ